MATLPSTLYARHAQAAVSPVPGPSISVLHAMAALSSTMVPASINVQLASMWMEITSVRLVFRLASSAQEYSHAQPASPTSLFTTAPNVSAPAQQAIF